MPHSMSARMGRQRQAPQKLIDDWPHPWAPWWRESGSPGVRGQGGDPGLVLFSPPTPQGCLAAELGHGPGPPNHRICPVGTPIVLGAPFEEQAVFGGRGRWAGEVLSWDRPEFSQWRVLQTWRDPHGVVGGHLTGGIAPKKSPKEEMEVLGRGEGGRSSPWGPF